MAFESDLENSDSDRSVSPEPDDPYYALSGPHVHNEMTLESKWPFRNVFGSSTWAHTCPYLIETTSDKISFFVKSLPEPKGRFFSLGINTRGQKHNHVLLFQFLLVSDWTHLTYTTKRFIVHFTLQDSFWLNKQFLKVEDVKNWFQISTKENVTFVMNLKYNVDHDFICHEPGHVKSSACRLAKKRFKKCPPQRRTFWGDNLLANYRENLGTFPGMQKVREGRAITSADHGRAMVKLPPFDTLLKKQNFGDLVGNRVGWLAAKPSSLQQSLVSDSNSMSYWNDRDLFPIMSRLARQLNENFRPQPITPNQELRPTPQHLFQSQERAQEALPSCSYHTRADNSQPGTSTSSRLPNIPFPGQQTSAWRFPERTAPPWASADETARFKVPEIPAHGSSTNVDVPTPPSRKRLATNRRRTRRRIIIACGGERFHINSKILEDASPVVKAFMKYWTPQPDPNGDIFLEIDGVTSVALENLLQYLTNGSFNHGVMRSPHMRELTRKLKIELEHI